MATRGGFKCCNRTQANSSLNTIIYPTLGKLLQANQGDEAVVMCLAQLKVAFDNAEKVKPGISHQFVVYLIETIRAFVSQAITSFSYSHRVTNNFAVTI